MRIVYKRCCGMDVHKKVIVACLLVLDRHGELHKQIRKFGTMTKDLLGMLDWLQAAGCTHVAMESTGVYWKPIYNILEGHLEVVVVNAQHLKGVPGRKTDVLDSEWLAECFQLGLLRASFASTGPGQRTTRPDSIPHLAHWRKSTNRKSIAKSAGGRQYQIGIGRN